MYKYILFSLLIYPASIATPEFKRETLNDIYIEASRKYGIDYELIVSIAFVESSHNHKAIARECIINKGDDCARGVMQIKPSTAKEICGLSKKDLMDRRKNIMCGTKYLAWIKKKYGRSVELIAGSYFTGPHGYRALGKMKNKKIKNYVTLVRNNIKK